MVVPPSRPPSWVTYQRRPHAYEDIMGAVQENLEWDDSDMLAGDVVPMRTAQSCELIKVEDSSLTRPSKTRQPHQYEEVELGQQVTPGGLGQLTPGGLGQLSQGWVGMRDEQLVPYYWHIPSGSTQYAHPVTGIRAKTVATPGVRDTEGYFYLGVCLCVVIVAALGQLWCS